MASTETRYQDLLIHEYEVRQNSNPAYSLRAYARDLGISVSNLSRILNGAQNLSLRKAENIAQVLGLSASETEYFYALIQSKHSRSEKMIAAVNAKLRSQEMVGAELSLEYFKTISDWHYFAIIELTGVRDFQSDSKWIAKRLGIAVETVEISLARLKKLELIEADANGKLKKTYEFRATPSGIPSRAIKEHHQQILKKAETALFERSIEDTDFSTVTFSMNPSDLAWAKSELKKFRRELTKRMANTPDRERIYSLAMQLFPLDNFSTPQSLGSKTSNPKKGNV